MQNETFTFTVVASGLDWTSPDFEHRFYDAGCDDALVSVVGGEILVDFDRSSTSIDEAVETAVRDVTRAGAVVTRVHR